MITDLQGRILRSRGEAKMKNINKIELLPQERSLLSNITSWLVLQSFHPLLAGFFF